MKDQHETHNVVPFVRDEGFLRARAQEHVRAGRMLEALELYRMLAARAPEKPLAQLELATHYSAMGAYELSNRLLFELLQRGQHEGACFFTLGSNYFAMQDYRRAQSCLLAAIRLQTDGQFTEEIEVMLDQIEETSLSEMGEGRVEKAMQRGIHALEAGYAQRAARWLTYATRKRGEDVEALSLLCFAYLACGKSKAALGCARRAYRRDKGSVYALCAMACSLYALGSPVMCAKFLDMADAQAELPQETALVCQSACSTGAHDLVLTLLREVHAEQPYTPALLHMLAAAHWNVGQVRKAAQHWGTLRRLDPANLVAAVMHERAKMLAAQGDIQEPPTGEDCCSYRLELSAADSIDKLLAVQQTLRQGPGALQKRFDEEQDFAAILAWGLTVPDENDATRFAMLSLLGTLRGQRSQRMLLSLLTDTEQSEEMKRETMGLLAKQGLGGPCYMESGGRVLRVMGQVLAPRVTLSPSCERILQAAVDRLTPRFGDVVQEVSGIWLPFVQRREDPGAPLKRVRLWIAALEYAYCARYHPPADLPELSRRQRVSKRSLRRYARRLMPEGTEE